jgi:hypothetical protein
MNPLLIPEEWRMPHCLFLAGLLGFESAFRESILTQEYP